MLDITLGLADPADLPCFKRELQTAFALAVVDEMGELPDGPNPSDEELGESLKAPNPVVLHILKNGAKVGGAVVSINRESQTNSLDLLFINVENHGRGLGKAACSAIEARFPETRTWETATFNFCAIPVGLGRP